jgi:hypothetical protein
VDERMFQRACAPTKASSRTVKPCGPDTPMLVSSLRDGDVGPDGPDTPRRRWWLTSPVHQGERGAAVNTIAQGMPDVLAEPVVLPPAFFAAGGPWVRPAPGIPCALYLMRDNDDASLGQFVPRECEVVSPVLSRPILRDGASRPLRMRIEQMATLNPRGEEPRKRRLEP